MKASYIYAAVFSFAFLGGYLGFEFLSEDGGIDSRKIEIEGSEATRESRLYVSGRNTLNPQQGAPIIPISDEPVIEKDNVRAIHLSYASYLRESFDDISKRVKNSSRLNAIVFEIKSPRGLVVFKDASQKKNLTNIIANLKKEGVHTIARMVLFEDSALVENNPRLGIKDSRTGGQWRDKNGIAWSDPTQRAVWEYNTDIAKEALQLGFDEINFDYVRFPTDGNISSATYTNLDEFSSRSDVIAEFLKFARKELGSEAVISVDVFGMTFISEQSAIGQNINRIAEHIDILAPMTYPSHYPPGFQGYSNPALYPYDVIARTLEKGKNNLTDQDKIIVRPWLQDFDLGANYGPQEIKSQIKATNDITENDTWFLWNAGNDYTWRAVE